MRAKPRLCFNLCGKPVRVPHDRPMFCSQRCAAEYAYEYWARSDDWLWCETHGEWEAECHEQGCSEAVQ